MKFDIDKMEREIASLSLRKWDTRHFNDLGVLLPEEQDPEVMFRNNYLAKGQSLALVAGSGLGKSSLTDQMAVNWAVGKPFLAAPMRPLKIAIIQAEDSKRDLQEQRDGIFGGLRAFDGWTDLEIAAADQNIVIPTDFVGRGGDEFMNLLRDFQGDTHQDLLVINPLQSFYGADVSSQEDAYHFTNGLDAIIKDANMACCAMLVMHTAKWKSGDRDKRQDVSDFAEYMMAGSHAWTDWSRAIIAFQKHGESDVYFDVKAAKRGKRLGWKDAENNPTTRKIMKHSDGFIYWQEVTDEAEIAAIPKPEEKPRGAPTKEPLNVVASASAVAKHYRELVVGKTRPKAIAALWENDRKKHTKEDWAKVYDSLVSGAEDYGFSVRDVTYENGKNYAILFNP